MLISEMIAFLGEMIVVIGQLVDCLPDSKDKIPPGVVPTFPPMKWEHDKTWEWCWEELSDEAQGQVALVRRKAVALLLRIEEIEKRTLEGN